MDVEREEGRQEESDEQWRHILEKKFFKTGFELIGRDGKLLNLAIFNIFNL